MTHELRNIIENAKEFIILLCIVVDIVAISKWLKYNRTADRQWRLSLGGVLIVTVMVAFQLWLFWVLLLR
jgi:hypothetical protein